MRTPGLHVELTTGHSVQRYRPHNAGARDGCVSLGISVKREHCCDRDLAAALVDDSLISAFPPKLPVSCTQRSREKITI